MLFIALLPVLLASVLARPTRRDLEIRDFEESYLSTREWQHHNTTVKLVGFTRLALSDDEAAVVKRAIRDQPVAWAQHQRDGTFFDDETNVVLVYFPVRDALVHHGRDLVEANHLGELEHRSVDGDLTIVGRFESQEVGGDDSNTVRDGMVLLNEPNRVLRRHGANVHFYDFGFRPSHSHAHGHDHGLEARKGGFPDGLFDKNYGCKRNHKNRICTFAIAGVATGRCGKKPVTESDCIDYNGWPISSCSKKSKVGFIGSDCFNAVGKGYCWNESRDYVCRFFSKSLTPAQRALCKH